MTELSHAFGQADTHADQQPEQVERPQYKTKKAQEKQRKREATERSNLSRSRLKAQAKVYDLVFQGSELLTQREFAELKARTSVRRKALGQLRRWMQKHDIQDKDFRRAVEVSYRSQGQMVTSETDLSEAITQIITAMQKDEALRTRLIEYAQANAKMRREKAIAPKPHAQRSLS